MMQGKIFEEGLGDTGREVSKKKKRRNY